MDTAALPLPSNLQRTTDRFVAVCHADARVVAAFLHGSYAHGTADVYSDLDLGIVTTDAAYDEFCAERDAFVRQFGTPLFLESFTRPHYAFFIFANGTEGELALTRPHDIQQVTRGPVRVLVDKTGVLAGTVLSGYTPTTTEQQEVVLTCTPRLDPMVMGCPIEYDKEDTHEAESVHGRTDYSLAQAS